MKLIGSYTSPYVRRLRLLLAEKKFEFEAIDIYSPAGEARLKEISPVNKIPVLIDGKKTIWDSRVIFRYLCEKKLAKELSWNEENYLTAVDGLLDSTINLFLFKKSGLDINGDLMYLKRQKARIEALLAYLHEQNIEKWTWNYLGMSFYSYLDWAVFREQIKIQNYPKFEKFLTKYRKKNGVSSTEIPKT
ncbi:MAG: glutathione S-transferase family protein [Bacteriovoracaceae bacterium]|nr:glutathione S-transferase family protein [Bacteriovoracaceae bacterium]